MAEFTFLRHAQFNDVPLDPGLSDEGVSKAKSVIGEFDLIICSPLKRCRQTLLASSLFCGKLIIDSLFRERVFASRDLMEHEVPSYIDNLIEESSEYFHARMMEFVKKLRKIDELFTGKKILLIGHSCFFNSWYRRERCACPPFAELIPLDRKRALYLDFT